MRFTIVRLGIAALMIGTLAGCGGGGGNNNTPAAAPAGGGAGGVAVPTGAAPITLTGTTPAATFAALAPVVTIGSVKVASPPVVSFSVTDAAGNAIIGLGSKSKSATATVASYPNFAFVLAKLVPGAPVPTTTTTTPSRWVSYIVTTVPTTTAPTAVATRPSSDNTGTLTDNGNGTYTYTFFRDITQSKAIVAATPEVAPNINADLDDLTFDPTLVHRLTIQISGNAPGTGSNTPDAVTVIPAVVMANPVNAIFDFTPATGTQIATTASGRDIVPTSKCNDCHKNLGGFPDASAADSDATFHGGSRNKIEYCVVCHTDQRKYGRAEAVVIPNATNGGNYDGKNTYKINTLGVGNLKTHIHKIHMSENLTKTGYNYGGIAYETACKFPQDVRNCTKCHDNSAITTPDPAQRTAQGDNWFNVPNRAACGACHDGINFEGTATIGINGTGQTLADFKAGITTAGTGHVGGVRHDDTQCALCHTATTIPVNHIPVTPPGPDNALLAGQTNANTNAASIASNTNRLPAGAIKISYEINSVSLNASRNPVMVFRILQDGARKDLNVFATTAVNPATGQKEIFDGFMGAPSVYFVYAVPQDGIAAPADFNASASSYLRSLWNGTAIGAAAGTLAGPDANGFYTATITGSTVPANAVMLTGGMGYSYNVKSSLPLTQTNLAEFPTAPATGAGLTPGMPNATGGLIVIAPNAQKVATGFTGRRPIVEDARCNKCHQELGTFTEDAFHAGQRNDGTTCAWCHNPNKTSSGWTADSTSFVHSIHAAAKRTVPYTWHAASKADGFFTIGYPGILSDCETCHLPSTFDFSAPASASALPNRLYRTSAAGTIVVDFTTSPEVTAILTATPTRTFGVAFAVDQNGAPTTPSTPAGIAANLVNSPIATTCFACHTDTLAIAHMKGNGASLYQPRGNSTALVAGDALATPEQCVLCHLKGKVADIGVVHKPGG